ncbi:nitrile hydratase subunit alpha [Paracraurococcus lichenis]|uniref:Nitrile hydratase subunit alpha n=1 Tax=Paracraurococcus lichenis TaxID=3064888 RepID=A0ABT9E154_9PROT|nr:nitrile hydratase subunit alpha [Paracraurococcus sp. LOR1-02]MDO9709835.1 nitrile hydratase subunit alpha [Paracraurococcus sp. LOR1-02]
MSAPARPDSIARLERLVAALAAKGIVTEAELAEMQARTDRASPEIGARMVARAWLDPDWRRLLLTDGAAAAERMGVSMAGAPPLGVLEDRPGLHHLVVCTLCSCYPRAVLGYPPGWYKSFEYRSRAVREPRAVLAEWGTVLPEGTKIRVVDSTADYRWMVLPMRPAGTEGWSEDQLAAIVTRDALVGVALPMAPLAAAAE